MKQLTCEMCGSTDITKQDGVYVCQTCGMKYSVEEAKKMMIEGTVEVHGTVKIDELSKVENYLSLAETAWDGEDIMSAVEYTDKALEIDINNYKAWVLRAKTVGWGSSLANNKTVQSITAAKKAISVAPDSEKTNVANELVNSLSLQILAMQQLASNLASTSLIPACKHIHTIMQDWLKILKLPHTSEKTIRDQISACEAAYNRSKNGPGIPSVKCFSSAADLYNNKEPYHITFKKAFFPNEIPQNSTPQASSGGCYVATCVYGSYDCPQVWTLRRYRDDTLGSTWYGRLFIRTYYAISPTLVKWFGKTSWFKKLWKGKLDRMVAKLQSDGVESTPYQDKNW